VLGEGFFLRNGFLFLMPLKVTWWLWPFGEWPGHRCYLSYLSAILDISCFSNPILKFFF